MSVVKCLRPGEPLDCKVDFVAHFPKRLAFFRRRKRMELASAMFFRQLLHGLGLVGDVASRVAVEFEEEGRGDG